MDRAAAMLWICDQNGERLDDKPTAGIVTAIIIAPLVALCCLGPVVIGSAVGGVLGWFSGQGLVIGVC
ncbi:hypothetical protein HED50_24405 [Ochrobactrum oryzae]|nr:hypothetical protein [Brucella oryzae]